MNRPRTISAWLATFVFGVIFAVSTTAHGQAGICWQITDINCCHNLVRMDNAPCAEPSCLDFDNQPCCGLMVPNASQQTQYASGGHAGGYDSSNFQLSSTVINGCKYHPAYCDNSEDPPCKHEDFYWTLRCRKWEQTGSTVCPI